MDSDTLQLLEDLPADLLARRWTLLEPESGRAKSAPWHRAVYRRPYDAALDTEYGSAVYDNTTRHRVVRVSTLKDQSGS